MFQPIYRELWNSILLTWFAYDIVVLFLCLCNIFYAVDDLRANTEYSGYSAASPVIQWFWEVVQGFSKEDKARLLQFVTGTSKVTYNYNTN